MCDDDTSLSNENGESSDDHLAAQFKVNMTALLCRKKDGISSSSSCSISRSNNDKKVYLLQRPCEKWFYSRKIGKCGKRQNKPFKLTWNLIGSNACEFDALI